MRERAKTPERLSLATTGGDEATFRESCERDFGLVLNGVIELLRDRQSALEIGCGTRRLLEPLIACFDRSYAISPGEAHEEEHMERLQVHTA
jgi:hypothetical protein